MSGQAMKQQTISEATSGGGLLVVAQWEAKEGQADNVAEILRSFLPEAQCEPGVKLFLISRGTENPAQFLFYELFRDGRFQGAPGECAFQDLYRGRSATAAGEARAGAIWDAVSVRGGKGLQPLPSARSPRTAECPETPACRHGHACGRARRSGAGSETPFRG